MNAVELELAAANRLIAALDRGEMRAMVDATRRRLAEEDKLTRFREIALGAPAEIAEAIRGFSDHDVVRFFRDLEGPAALALLAHLVLVGDDLEGRVRRGWIGDGYSTLAAEIASELTDAVPRYVSVTSPRGLEIEQAEISAEATAALSEAGFEARETTSIAQGSSYGVRLGPVPEAERTFRAGRMSFSAPQYGRAQPEVMLASAWETLLKWHPHVRGHLDAGALEVRDLTEQENRAILRRDLGARARTEDVVAAVRGTRRLLAPAPAPEPTPAPAPEPTPAPAPAPRYRLAPAGRRGLAPAEPAGSPGEA